MEENRSRVTTDDLLAHMGWIHALARALAREPEAEDIAQDALVLALERPPRRDGALQPWLAGVVRNLVRKRRRERARRADREWEAFAPENAPTPEELAQRVALQQEVAQAVLRLEEPHRSTLLLHYFENLSVAAIAELQQVRAEAVRQRLVRGRAQLRERLDRHYGERSRWTRSCHGLRMGQAVRLPVRRAWRAHACARA